MLYVVGIGPGSREMMTGQAVKALEDSQVIVGYTGYIQLICKDFAHKQLLATPMMQEVDRCKMALEQAAMGKTVSMVCSGDAGVYGMAGLLLELQKDYEDVTISVVPGVTAACGGAALLGAPLSHDFVVISLSDLLTPMELIEKRISLAAQGDFVICLYNPSSKKRGDYLKRACQLVMLYQSGDTVCGVTRNIGRQEETVEIMSLRELSAYQADMFTTVFIGNSTTMRVGDHMVTPRGYLHV